MKITMQIKINVPEYIPIIEIVNQSNNKSILIQDDWEYPSVATTFGWSTVLLQKKNHNCKHKSTDGTINCPDCGITAKDFIESAYYHILLNNGAKAEDPGYFSNNNIDLKEKV